MMAHYYLYAPCKTSGCPGHLLLMHLEAPDVPHIPMDYPDEYLFLSLRCPGCQQVHSYIPTDLRTKSSVDPLHDPTWRPILPYPPPTRGTNYAGVICQFCKRPMVFSNVPGTFLSSESNPYEVIPLTCPSCKVEGQYPVSKLKPLFQGATELGDKTKLD